MAYNGILQLFLIPLCVTILGSIIYGFLSRRKKEFKITCEQLSLRQYKERESGDVKISLSYKNEKVGDSLSVLTVRLVNNGKKDIAFNQVFEDKIQLELKNAEILDVVIEKQSDKVAASIEKTESLGWLLSWSILKKGEQITLKIVSVNHCDEDKGNEDVGDLIFVFRGNNLDAIEPVSSQSWRTIYWSLIIACVILLGLGALMPTRVDVLYDVVVDGKCIRDAKVSYNEYTQVYNISHKGKTIVKTADLQSVAVAKQPTVLRDVIIMAIILFVYIIGMIIYFIYYRRRKKAIFFKIMGSLMSRKV